MTKKLILDSSDEIWNEVLKHKIDNKFKNNNETVIDLIQKGLKYEKNIK